jgi:hypothetical protein
MNLLLELRLNSGRPVHYDELRRLTLYITQQTIDGWTANPESQPPETNDTATYFPPTAKSLEDLLIRITNSIKSDGLIWEILAVFYQSFVIANERSTEGFHLAKHILRHCERSYLECRVKHVNTFTFILFIYW